MTKLTWKPKIQSLYRFVLYQSEYLNNFFHQRKKDFLKTNVTLVMYSDNRLKKPNAVQLQTLSASTALKVSVKNNGA